MISENLFRTYQKYANIQRDTVSRLRFLQSVNKCNADRVLLLVKYRIFKYLQSFRLEAYMDLQGSV